MIDYLEKNELLSVRQHGYYKDTANQLQHDCVLQSLHYWTHCIDSGHDVDVINFDFLKALDRVPHHLHIEKLSHYGLSKNIIPWIETF